MKGHTWFIPRGESELRIELPRMVEVTRPHPQARGIDARRYRHGLRLLLLRLLLLRLLRRCCLGGFENARFLIHPSHLLRRFLFVQLYKATRVAL